MKLTSIHPRFGLRIEDIDLAEVTADFGYPEIRSAFEESSFLHFPNQEIDDASHLRLAAFFGPREDRTIHREEPLPEVSLVTNVKPDGSVFGKSDSTLQNLQANMLWHTDSTFLPAPALANILIARIIPPSGTATEFCSTRIAWEDMPEALKSGVKGLYFKHDYTHSRKKIDPMLAGEEMFAHWPQQIWKSAWKNPVNGKTALYIASHASGVVGMGRKQALDLINELIEWCTQDQYVYRHTWCTGDVLVWDERAMLHRGVPWNYDEPRTLSSICVSATEQDGLEDMRYDGKTRGAFETR